MDEDNDMDKVRFLLARIAEDESVARAAAGAVLRDCEWRRKLVEQCAFFIQQSDDVAEHPEYATDGENRARIHGVGTGCALTLDYLAAPYADHPDHGGEAWGP